MQSLLDQLYDAGAKLAHAQAQSDLIGVMQLESQMNTLLDSLSAIHGGDDDASI
ncbi:hypothetical protein P3H15_27305 [Rhodococcus sp. T2V]|uniref:hypothetical protein n=1 Tax=Rhodococcus sp. T2V TaxID=3034164 RepID=UPI0023E29D97|nr:hypothetical protein [Rhodococcus sp. T2V]MDF3308730.1 hypothetical protein [Rhodococcus sp. T2V]